jgi:hypothetical protein
MARLVQAAAILLISATVSTTQDANNKRLIASTLDSLREAANTLPQSDSTQSIIRSVSWFQERVPTWTPANATEGLALLSSLGEILQAVRDLHAANGDRETLLIAIEEDLRIKLEHCRQWRSRNPAHCH